MSRTFSASGSGHLGADQIVEFRCQAHLRGRAGGGPNLCFSEYERRMSASGTSSVSGTERTGGNCRAKLAPAGPERARLSAPSLGVKHFSRPTLLNRVEASAPTSGVRVRQGNSWFRPFAGLNIGAEFDPQPNFGFSQHLPNLGDEQKLQNRKRGEEKWGPTSPGPCVYDTVYVYEYGCTPSQPARWLSCNRCISWFAGAESAKFLNLQDCIHHLSRPAV